ncbi:peptidoglycan bridge formation glycyltransferase FemA/FemB family protein [Calidifontibacter sp. DB0510]|uniref:Peptidoglycan bridge formation glycyltransferase FemA/FemB family protein n=1 Tax=Metallococcus carri TaxID=1656884 RepID=A0A967EAD4_9MICO|nr:peptidoglycan bridge formation glycyltransferase FemA/FemB family protein [Metallococcus carri]NHN57347.1 peptidoglycan bridge formation glycyltransferase FemA/FemB family protein [Metallococcus carri]NOP39125.1 peptidoglycan bridge formation glycyltransferase FemA/FemB family protein [Calidifontibacter sp. DB2511S]
MSLRVTPCADQETWDATIDETGGHPLQLWGWGELKSRYDWTAQRLLVHEGDTLVGSAQVLYRKLPPPLRSLAYVPRGPQAAEADRARVLDALSAYIKAHAKPVGITIEPDWEQPGAPLPKGATEQDRTDLVSAEQPEWLKAVARVGFSPSANTGLIPYTLIVDLTQDEDAIMKDFKSSTRQNVRKSFKAEGVRFGLVESDADLEQVLAINRETAKRAGFAVHSDDYHRAIRDLLGDRSQLIAAWEGDEVVAFVWLVVSRRTAFELYGGVSPRGMKLRLNYGLKFWAMQHCKAQGVERYDFNGLLNDGISDFKRQFASHEDLLIGTWDRPLSPLFPLFSSALPKVRTALKKGVPAAKAKLDELRGGAGPASDAPAGDRPAGDQPTGDRPTGG